eukprot:scaffold1567_cov102-Cylindrotheca_fusiformis.AAC.1
MTKACRATYTFGLLQSSWSSAVALEVTTVRTEHIRSLIIVGIIMVGMTTTELRLGLSSSFLAVFGQCSLVSSVSLIQSGRCGSIQLDASKFCYSLILYFEIYRQDCFNGIHWCLAASHTVIELSLDELV